jgi:hypothetical protein
VTKVIRVKNSTFDTLVNLGKWTDTMDDIISKLIVSNVKYNKSDKSGKTLIREAGDN